MAMASMASTIIQKSTANWGELQEGSSRAYHAAVYLREGDSSNGGFGGGFVTGGSSPLLGNLGLPYLRGDPYENLLGGPPGEGGGAPGRGGSGGSGGGGNAGPPWQVGAAPLMGNNSLKGTMLAIFDRNWKNTKQFTQEFTLYQMIDQDVATMRNAYTHIALVLSFMQGPTINDWVLQ